MLKEAPDGRRYHFERALSDGVARVGIGAQINQWMQI